MRLEKRDHCSNPQKGEKQIWKNQGPVWLHSIYGKSLKDQFSMFNFINFLTSCLKITLLHQTIPGLNLGILALTSNSYNNGHKLWDKYQILIFHPPLSLFWMLSWSFGNWAQFFSFATLRKKDGENQNKFLLHFVSKYFFHDCLIFWKNSN